jgi:hypothetical protein
LQNPHHLRVTWFIGITIYFTHFLPMQLEVVEPARYFV